MHYELHMSLVSVFPLSIPGRYHNSELATDAAFFSHLKILIHLRDSNGEDVSKGRMIRLHGKLWAVNPRNT